MANVNVRIDAITKAEAEAVFFMVRDVEERSRELFLQDRN